MAPRTIIHWFRKGLRIHDNPALDAAVQIVRANPDTALRPIFILDPGILKWLRVGPNRWRFLQQALVQLNENLMAVNSKLYVVRGNPKDTLPRLFEDWNVSHITFESDIEPYAQDRDAIAEIHAQRNNVILIQKTSHTIFDPNVIIAKNQGKAPMQYQRFLSIVNEMKAPEPIAAPSRLPNNSKPSLDGYEMLNAKCYDCPTLAELKVDVKSLGPNLYPGGETEALQRMSNSLKNHAWVCKFSKPNTSPNSLEPSTTVLSPYLKFGCLSVRLLLKELRAILRTTKNPTQPPVSLLGQVWWREFYYVVAASERNFDRMKGNSICRQIPWKYNAELLDAWTNGRTGYPFIDAVMRQLRQEGWIHHLARHAVACFLTRGDLWISWEEGQKVFEELLLDADWALNAGNWMWLSASAFFYQYFRVYSPVAFGKKTDKSGEYIRKYVPELKAYPANMIYEPWKASAREQNQFKCVLGKDYPHRVVIHEVVSKVNMGRMASAYKAHNEGRDIHEEEDDKKKTLLLVKKKIKEAPASPATTSVVREISELAVDEKKPGVKTEIKGSPPSLNSSSSSSSFEIPAKRPKRTRQS